MAVTLNRKVDEGIERRFQALLSLNPTAASDVAERFNKKGIDASQLDREIVNLLARFRTITSHDRSYALNQSVARVAGSFPNLSQAQQRFVSTAVKFANSNGDRGPMVTGITQPIIDIRNESKSTG